MTRYMLVPAALALVLAAWTAPAEAAKAGAASPPEQGYGIFRFVSGQETKSPCGKYEYEKLTMVPAVGGSPQHIHASKGAMASLHAGDLVELRLQKGYGGFWIKSCKPYKMKPGEDQPGVFVLQRTIEEEVAGQKRFGIEVTKFDQHGTLWVPNVRNDQREMEPDPRLAAQVRVLKSGESVKVEVTRAGTLMTLRDVTAYIPPKEGEFVQTAKQTVGDQEHLVATFKAGGETVTALVRNTPAGKSDPKLAAVVTRLKAGQAVTFSIRRDGDQVWLDEIKVASR